MLMRISLFAGLMGFKNYKGVKRIRLHADTCLAILIVLLYSLGDFDDFNNDLTDTIHTFIHPK